MVVHRQTDEILSITLPFSILFFCPIAPAFFKTSPQQKSKENGFVEQPER